MSYFKSEKGETLYFGESEDADRAARFLGLKPVSAPPIPTGATFSPIGSGLSRIDAPLASLADAYGGSGFADEY